VELLLYIPFCTERKFLFYLRLCLTLCHQVPRTHSVVMWMRPYHNDRLITVIRDLYFCGGATSFATRFDNLFIQCNGNAPVTHEIPGAMLCLVATVASYQVLVVDSTLNWFFLALYCHP
jgi:hypothetical protein